MRDYPIGNQLDGTSPEYPPQRWSMEQELSMWESRLFHSACY